MADAKGPGCWGEGPGKPICQETPAIRTVRLVTAWPKPDTSTPMDFCRRHFWLWNAASLELRGEPELEQVAQAIKRHVRAGNFDAAPRPPVQAIPFAMVAPDYGFDEPDGDDVHPTHDDDQADQEE